MIAKIDKEENTRDIFDLQIIRLKADIVPILNVQRGVDIYISFRTIEKLETLKNVRVLHFSGVKSKPWNEAKAREKVLAYIIDGNVISNFAAYPDPIPTEND